MSSLLSLLSKLFGSSTSTKQPQIPKPLQPSALSKPTKPDEKLAHSEPPWVVAMRQALGLHETRNKSTLISWLKSDGDLSAHPDKTPWCGEAVATAFKLTLPMEKIPVGHWASISWMSFGTLVKPQIGCILVFWRGNKASRQGHVGFYVGEDSTHFHVLGGNQSDAITIKRIAKSRLRPGGTRWPTTGPRSTGATRVVSGGSLDTSTNEA